MLHTSKSTATLSATRLVVSALLVSLGAAIGQGFARFGYALLLPPMRADWQWSYAEAGLVNSANALGYLLGALVVGASVSRWGPQKVVRASVLAVSLSLIATGLTDQFWGLLLARVVSGFGAGLMFVAGVSVVLALDPSQRSDLAVGVYFAGPGIGIALSGLLVPLLLDLYQWDWRAAWMLLGGIGIATLVVIERPLYLSQRTQPPVRRSAAPKLFVLSDYQLIWSALLAYCLFGLGYIGYMTFIIAYLRQLNVAAEVTQWFWVGIGICAALSGFTWRVPIRSLSPRWALFWILLAMAVGVTLPVMSTSIASIALSAVLFGSSFLTIVTVITKEVKALLPADRWTAVVGNATALFALGQLLGPTLTGLIADLQGGLTLGLLGSAALLGCAALIALIPGRR